jgi:FMN-dependent NADH-azoreductase
MPTLLRLDSSARDAGSFSRRLGDATEAAWLGAHPGGRVLRRDLAALPPPHLDTAAMGGFFTPPEKRTPDMRAAMALSELLTDELLSADTLLITAPIYNFGIPSALKAWLDHVVRVGRTFSYDGANFTGLAGGRDAVLALAYGAKGYIGGPLAAADHALPYLRFVLGFIGIAPVQAFAVEGTTGGAEAAEAALATATRAVDAAFAPALAA